MHIFPSLSHTEVASDNPAGSAWAGFHFTEKETSQLYRYTPCGGDKYKYIYGG